jgi:hypothetical protein
MCAEAAGAVGFAAQEDERSCRSTAVCVITLSAPDAPRNRQNRPMSLQPLRTALTASSTQLQEWNNLQSVVVVDAVSVGA